jgi:hypothetical protein
MTHFSDEAVKIAQKAQAAATLEPMTSFDQEDKLEATVSSELYEEFIQGMLTEEYWRFAVTQKVLNHLTDAPDGRWSDAWQLPQDPAVLSIKAVTVEDMIIPFERYADKIYCNYNEENEVLLDYVYRVGEEYWPPDFKLYVILRFGAVLAASITRNGDVVEGLQQQAEIQRLAAIRNHSQGRTAQKLNTKRLVRRRR